MQTVLAREAPYVVGVELTRRNLLALLAKLDGNPPNSACTLERQGFFVKAVENEAHYSDRLAGGLHVDTEYAIRRAQ